MAPASPLSPVADVKNAIALCLGGVDPLRTFTGWVPVIHELVQHGKNEFLLIGSDNGLFAAQQIKEQFGD